MVDQVPLSTAGQSRTASAGFASSDGAVFFGHSRRGIGTLRGQVTEGAATGHPRDPNGIESLAGRRSAARRDERDRLDIQASVDLAGLKKLKEMLTKFEGILEMLGPNDSK